MFNLVVAIDQHGGFSKDGKFPWDVDKIKNIIKDEMARHSKMIAIIADQETLDMFGLELDATKVETIVVDSPDTIKKAVKYCKSSSTITQAFVLGGHGVFKNAIFLGVIRSALFIHIKKIFECDVPFPFDIWNQFLKLGVFQGDSVILQESDETMTRRVAITKINHSEMQYIELIRDILDKDKIGRQTRNGKCFSSFGERLRFNMKEGFPLLTTKKMFWRGIVEELLMFLKGNTDTSVLESKGINIWKGNTNKEFLEKIDLKGYEEGDMGPMYGFQWRHFGEEYKGADHEYKGLDQLKYLIKEIKNNPTSRRLMMTSFNPLDTSKSVLPPCHSIITQFYVSNGNLDMIVYNRSQDVFLGVPFNIASHALLLHIIAKITNLDPRELTINMGDSHIYQSHLKAVREQLKRRPNNFPSFEISKEVDEDEISWLENLRFEDFKLDDYHPHDVIKAPLVS